MIRLYAAAALLAMPAVAQAQQQCIPPQKLGDAAVVAAPILIDTVAAACRPHVPASAFLSTGAASLSARLRSEGAPRVESALSVLRLIGGKDIPEIEDQAALLSVLGGLAQGMLAKEIPPETCPGLSGVVEALAPLPADNIALLGSSMARAIAASDAKRKQERADAAAEAAKNGDGEAEAPRARTGPDICLDG